MISPGRFFAVVIAASSLAGCASLPGVCISPAQPMVSAEMLFGRKIGDRVGVSDADFARFAAQEITPRFPDGLTIIDARGQYRDTERARLIREPSKLVLLTFRDDPQKRVALGEIAETYKTTFKQQSVLTTVRQTCASF
jgi:hypothetical protein